MNNGILVKSGIIVLSMMLFQFIIRYFFKFEGLFDVSTVMSLVAPTIFLIGYAIGSVSQDYKESEKIPANLIGFIESFYDSTVLLTNKEEANKIRKRIIYSILRMFITGKFNLVYDNINSAIEDIRNQIVESTPPAYISKFNSDSQNILSVIRRVETIKTTQSIPVIYTLLRLLIFSVCTFMLFATYTNVYAMYVITFIIPLMFSYMYLLIKDIDDPFEYNEDGTKAGNAEVDITIFVKYARQNKADY